jgi:hypothetical protein
LSDADLRVAYDKHGKESARPTEGFVDPAEFFTSIFGGDSFVDWIGEISLMKDLTATMDITMAGGEGEEEGAAAPGGEEEFPGTDEAIKESMKTAGTAAPPTVVVEDEVAEEKKTSSKPAAPAAGSGPTLSPSDSRTSTPGPTSSGATTPRSSSRTGIPIRPALMDRPSDEDSLDAASGKDVKGKDKKGKPGLSKEQREQLAAYERERARIRQERVDTLTRKLLDRLSVWTETDRDSDVTAAFMEKSRLEVEELKMESFGIDILHAIGATYVSKGTALLRSQKFFGMGGFLSRVRDKGTLVKDTWNTISSAIDAQASMEEMVRAEQAGGEEWTDERKVELERRVTGKILTAAWRGSRFEIQSVLRDVCDAVLNDKKVQLSKRLQRAEALVIIGEICANVSLNLSFPPLISYLTDHIHHTRPSDLPKKKATTWHSSSWSPRPLSRRRRNPRRRVETRRTRPPPLRRVINLLQPRIPLRLLLQLPMLPTYPRDKSHEIQRSSYREHSTKRHI